MTDQREHGPDLSHGPDALAYALTGLSLDNQHPRLVREALFAETDFDRPFMARFICRTCGPTNRVVGGSEGYICVVCQQAAAYQIMSDCGVGPHV